MKTCKRCGLSLKLPAWVYCDRYQCQHKKKLLTQNDRIRRKIKKVVAKILRDNKKRQRKYIKDNLVYSLNRSGLSSRKIAKITSYSQRQVLRVIHRYDLRTIS